MSLREAYVEVALEHPRRKSSKPDGNSRYRVMSAACYHAEFRWYHGQFVRPEPFGSGRFYFSQKRRETMRFVIQTTYDQKGMTAMARTLRKSLRRKKSTRTHIFGGVFFAVVLLLLIAEGWPFSARGWMTAVIALAVLVVLLWQDQLNGWLAGRKTLPGMELVEAVFTEDEYVNRAATVETHWHHEQIKAAFETKDYFVFFLSDRHGQIYDKHGFLEGTPEDFRTFISEQTGKPVEYIK